MLIVKIMMIHGGGVGVRGRCVDIENRNEMRVYPDCWLSSFSQLGCWVH